MLAWTLCRRIDYNLFTTFVIKRGVYYYHAWWYYWLAYFFYKKFSFHGYLHCTDNTLLDGTSSQYPTFVKYGTQISHDKRLEGGNFGNKILTSLLNCLLNRADFGNRNFAALDVL